MSKICRLCLQESKNYYPLDTDDYRLKMRSVVPEIDVEIVEEPFICVKCSELLLSAYSFKSNCLHTDKELKTFAKDDRNRIQIDEFLKQKNKDLLLSTVKIEIYDTNETVVDKRPDENDTTCKQKQSIVINKCPVCKKILLRKSSLDLHLKRHQNTSRYYKCTVCDISMPLKSTLREHMRVHTGERPYQCTHCGKSFAQSSTLGTHVRSVHMSQRPYVCDICGMSFKVRGAYTAHKRLRHDTVEKKFVCTFCGKAYLIKSKLEQHMLWHKGERNYLCQVCSKGFVSKGSLTRHLAIHKGEKPHECPICQKTFTQINNMKIHLQSCSRRNARTSNAK